MVQRWAWNLSVVMVTAWITYTVAAWITGSMASAITR